MIRLTVLAMALLVPAAPAAAFEFKDGDHVVLVGSTLIEREQRYGYWETALTARYPDRTITFRNLGWSGDTVWGEARAGFGTPADGYKHLVDHVRAEKPTVIIVGYGTNESFAGPEGLPKFKEQLKKLLDDLAATRARLILLAPPLVGENEWKAGKAAERNRQVNLYSDAIREEAAARAALFIPDFGCRHGPASPLTDNGMHLTPWGYWFTMTALVTELKVPDRGREPIEITGAGPVRVRQLSLPYSPPPPQPGDRSFNPDSALRLRDVKPGRYSLTIDGQAVAVTSPRRIFRKEQPEMSFEVKAGAADDALDLLTAARGPSQDQVEKLRQAIVAKNELYFHRWRPQNVTYLFGFRKHEQGNNAREIPQFDPLVAAKEKEIAELKKPREHVYELVPARSDRK